ncbi:NAD(P)/FAD-dependent oxidoreductase [Marilutibacter alkalisoli]|uniref:Halogenase n=1 Tax=Marilutibacter alkalisoli TaxID=2591633 RepID=A0A514BNV7_9GAMM|nr:tryptophan 7-halogenase [Lysobacter alkalisoli]QDH69077.1 halogenase [Lysobacter alkalisoli]
MPEQPDAVILGGGLAGLSLALQLRTRFPEIRVLVLERRAHPLPVAAHKVGESTVEIGAHYFAHTLGLREHLEQAHLRKFGFRFFFSDGRRDLPAVTELGVKRVLPTPTYQIDRGIFENFLGEEARRRGVDFRAAATVRGFEVAEGDGPHRVRFEDAAGEHQVQARWLFDASGRAGLLKRRLDLAEPNDHDANAVWFRLDQRLALDEWCGDPEWHDLCSPPERWRSTNHMVGPGYWVWLIPLSSGAHSVGIVADAKMHPLETMNSFERALEWLHRHQPLVADHVESARDTLMDFAFFRDFSYGCRQVFSPRRWALTGESGLFLDPFYSPGSDFIAIANTYICELVERDREGASLAPYARIYEELYFSFYRNMLTLYRDQYPIFGNAEVLPLKVLWDYAYYWGVLCPLVFQQRLADIGLLGELRPQLEQAQALNARMQQLFRDWHEAGGHGNPAVMLDQGELDWFYELNRGLHDSLDDAGVRAHLRGNIELLERLAAALEERAGRTSSVAGARPALFGQAA